MADLAHAHAAKPVDAADGCQVVIHLHYATSVMLT
jgi:hypothetical protein